MKLRSLIALAALACCSSAAAQNTNGTRSPDSNVAITATSPIVATGRTLSCSLCVVNTRTIATTSPLAGGGDLSANRTLSITTGGIGNALLTNSSVTVNTTAPLAGGGALSLGSSLTLTHADSGVTAGSCTLCSLTYDAKGHVSAASNGSASAYQTVADEGTGLAGRTTLNFIGAGVTCADNAGATRTDCTIPGGSATQAGSTTASNVPYASGANTLSDTALSYASGTKLFTHANNGIGSALTPALDFSNTTAATVSQVQRSTGEEWIAQGWKQSATAASQTVKTFLQLVPISISGAANNATGIADWALTLFHSVNGETYGADGGDLLRIRPYHVSGATATGGMALLTTMDASGTGAGLTGGGRGIAVQSSSSGYIDFYVTNQYDTGLWLYEMAPTAFTPGDNGNRSLGGAGAKWDTTWTNYVRSNTATMNINGNVADGSGAIEIIMGAGQGNALTAGRLVSFQNYTSPAEKSYVDWNGAYYATSTSLGTAQTVGLSAGNQTAAANNAQQFGGVIESAGAGWKTNATAASQAVKWGWQTRPIQGAAAPNGDMVLWLGIGAGAYAEQFKFVDRDVTSAGIGGNGLLSGQTTTAVYNSSLGGMSFQGASTIAFAQSGTTVLQLTATALNSVNDLIFVLGAKATRFNGLFNGGVLSAKYNHQTGTTYTVLATDFYVGMSNAAARTVTLPAASALPAGGMLWVMDEANTGATANITINRAGSDTINGGTSTSIILNSGSRGLISDGVSKWFVITSI